MEIDENRIDSLKDAIDCAVVQVKETKCATMAGLSFDIRHMQHVGQIENVGVEMNAISSVSDIPRKVRQISILDVLLDLDVLDRKLRYLGINSLTGPVFIPAASSHFVHSSFKTLKL